VPEALDAPTPDEVAALFSPRRLRLARELRGLSQRQLSDAVGVTSAAMSQFEKADAKPSVATLQQIAAQLRMPLPFFATGSAPSSRDRHDAGTFDGTGHFRSLRSVTAPQRRSALSVAYLVRDVADVLSHEVRLPARNLPRMPLTAGDPPEAAERIAAQIRAAWEVPPGPIPDVVRLLERNGVVCARFRTDSAAVDAFSVPFRECVVVVLDSDKSKRDRERFSAAHELAHLIMHDPDNEPNKAIENQAHRFAAALLMPAEEIRPYLTPRVNWASLLSVKLQWGVSLAALLMRGKTLGVLSDTAYAQAMKVMGMRGWRRTEPGDLGPAESPTLLSAALQVAAGRGLTVETLSSQTGWPASLIEEVLAASGDDRPALTL
jgi:Zn-dependent peptidase ImmA (M78 family)/transcriptional regulator with XRE-family HTH domain